MNSTLEINRNKNCKHQSIKIRVDVVNTRRSNPKAFADMTISDCLVGPIFFMDSNLTQDFNIHGVGRSYFCFDCVSKVFIKSFHMFIEDNSPG